MGDIKWFGVLKTKQIIKVDWESNRSHRAIEDFG